MLGKLRLLEDSTGGEEVGVGSWAENAGGVCRRLVTRRGRRCIGTTLALLLPGNAWFPRKFVFFSNCSSVCENQPGLVSLNTGGT